MPVNTVHPDYNKVSKRWCLIRAIINNCAQDYLRTPDVNDMVRSRQYKEDAVLTNFTNLTKIGLVGLIFRKDPTIQLPDYLDYLFNDVTGSGITVWQFSQYLCGEVLQTGRFGVLVDFYNDNQKAYLKPYCAESIINWKAQVINGVCQTSLVVLQETEILEKEEDVFCQERVTKYRVLRLGADSNYIQEIYNEKLELVSRITPVDYNSNPYNYIPFVWFGSENNDWTVDYQPIYDIARLNLAHYQDSADYQESIFTCGQPYLVVNVGESSQEEFIQANPNGIAFGSRKALIIAAGGDAKLLQANPNQLVAQAMKEKLEQAASIGAKLIAPPGGRETAEAAKIRYGSQHSALYTLTSNVAYGMELCFYIAASFMTGTLNQDIQYTLNDQFYDETADPNIIAQQIMLLDRGVIAKKDVIDYGKKTGFIAEERALEDIEQETDQVDPLE